MRPDDASGPAGGDLAAALRERETRAERQINWIRLVAVAVTGVMDVVYAALIGKLTPAFAVEGAGFLAVFGLYIAAVHRFTADGRYRPWLKYCTITSDFALTLLIFVGYRRLGLFTRSGPESGAAEFVAFFILLNMLSAFRQSRAAILYSTAIGVVAVFVIALRYSGSISLTVCAPVIVASSGLLTHQISNGLRDLFVRIRQRERLLRFLPREVVRGVDAGEIRLTLGGVKREVTILLADIRDSTHLAEHRDPEQVVAMLNRFFTEMAGIIWERRGTIDKFIGDAILAVFGAPVAHPDDPTRALDAALEMQTALDRLNETWAREGLPALRMGIALHTGDVVAGNVGAPERMEYTVMGDAVNVTARIEKLNKSLGTRMLLSEATLERVREHCAARPVGELPLRGRDEPVRLYAVDPPGMEAPHGHEAAGA